MEKVIGNGNAFVAVKQDGSLVTWGDPDYGGDSSATLVGYFLTSFDVLSPNIFFKNPILYVLKQI